MNKLLLAYSLAVQVVFGVLALFFLLMAAIAAGNLLALGLGAASCLALCLSHSVQADWLVLSILREGGGYVSGSPARSPRWSRIAYVAAIALAVLAYLALVLIH